MTALAALIEQLQQRAVASRQRRLLLISGERSWCYDSLHGALDPADYRQPTWIGDPVSPDPALSSSAQGYQYLVSSAVAQMLGREVDLLVYDAFAGLHPNAFAAATGMLRGGGLFIVLAPALEAWADYPDSDYWRMGGSEAIDAVQPKQFLVYLAEQMRTDARVSRFIQLPDNSGLWQSDSSEADSFSAPSLDEQQQAVAQILRVARGRRHKPLVLLSDRGRGKSAALGLAVNTLLRDSQARVLLCSSSRASVQTVFDFAAQGLPLVANPPTVARLDFPAGGSLHYVAADELLVGNQEADLLLIDEAASLPLSVLEQLLSRFPRIVFSSTVHGYEGSGRGFELKFFAILDRLTPRWRRLRLQQPIRWSANDPLEAWLFDLFMFQADSNALLVAETPVLDHCRMRRVGAAELRSQPCLLRSVFGLLVNAHYQTTPDDLRTLLDGVDIELYLLEQDGQLLAAALLSVERPLTADLAQAVWQGRRRPRGHLLSQTLLAHCGHREAADFHYHRIMRIAVQPALQRRGLGKLLIAGLREQLAVTGNDFLGTSFAAQPEVVAFWQACGFQLLRLGFRRDSSSGSFSALMLCALHGVAAEQGAQWQRHFLRAFRFHSVGVWAALDTRLLLALGHCLSAPAGDPSMDAACYRDAASFCRGYRGYEDCADSLDQLVWHAFLREDGLQSLNETQRALLLRSILQRQPAAQVCAELSYRGRRQWLAALRQAIAQLLCADGAADTGLIDTLAEVDLPRK